jgi:hypothetical protein
MLLLMMLLLLMMMMMMMMTENPSFGAHQAQADGYLPADFPTPDLASLTHTPPAHNGVDTPAQSS